jgi:hypothetical protein
MLAIATKPKPHKKPSTFFCPHTPYTRLIEIIRTCDLPVYSRRMSGRLLSTGH